MSIWFSRKPEMGERDANFKLTHYVHSIQLDHAQRRE